MVKPLWSPPSSLHSLKGRQSGQYSLYDSHGQSPLSQCSHESKQSDYVDGLEVVPHERTLTTALPPQIAYSKYEKEVVQNIDPPLPHQELVKVPIPPPKSRRRLWVIALIVVAVAIIISVVAAILAVRKTSARGITAASNTKPIPKNSNNQTISNQISANESVPSLHLVTGALNGTGLATMFPDNDVDLVDVFYQHYTGEIRYARLSGNGIWQAAEALEIKDATYKTSLSSIEYTTSNNTITRRVFYINTSGFIRDVFQIGNDSTWANGSLWDYDFTASGPCKVGLSIMFLAKVTTDEWLILYAGGNDGLVHEYACNLTDNTWSTGFTFPGTNGYAGSAVTPDDLVLSLYLQNSDDELELWWKDQSVNGTRDDSPLTRGTWTKGADAGTPIRKNSTISLCTADDTIYYQDPEGTVQSIGWNGATDLQRWDISQSVDSAVAIPGASVTCGFFHPLQGGSNSIHVYFQTNGSNIAEFSRVVGDQDWSFDYLPLL